MSKNQNQLEKLESDNELDFETALKLLCAGYLRREFDNENIRCNPTDIASIIPRYLSHNILFEWQWDHCSKKNKNHQITNNKTTFQCNNVHCDCFTCCSIPMMPNSGTYRIKLKIDKIDNSFVYNCIGISANAQRCINGKINWRGDEYYIAWSSNGEWDKEYTKHGLLCSYENQFKNIFYQNGFKYQSKNEYNIDSLPKIDENDVIKMLYDSDRNELHFKKENDNTCNSKIINLPKNVTCYWFIGHSCNKMSISIL